MPFYPTRLWRIIMAKIQCNSMVNHTSSPRGLSLYCRTARGSFSTQRPSITRRPSWTCEHLSHCWTYSFSFNRRNTHHSCSVGNLTKSLSLTVGAHLVRGKKRDLRACYLPKWDSKIKLTQLETLLTICGTSKGKVKTGLQS